MFFGVGYRQYRETLGFGVDVSARVVIGGMEVLPGYLQSIKSNSSFNNLMKPLNDDIKHFNGNTRTTEYLFLS